MRKDMKRTMKYLVLLATTLTATIAFAGDALVKSVTAVPDNSGQVQIEVELTAPIAPQVTTVENPDRLIFDFSGATPRELLQHIPVNRNGVKKIRVGLNRVTPPLTRVVVDLESARPFGIESVGNKVVLSILPVPAEKPISVMPERTISAPKPVVTVTAVAPAVVRPKTENPPVELVSEQSSPASLVVRRSFRVKYVAGNSAYIDGGSNAGLKEGMKLVIRDFDPFAEKLSGTPAQGGFVAEVTVVAVATTSAVADVRVGKRRVHKGDFAMLNTEETEAVAAAKVLGATGEPQIKAFALRQTDDSMPPMTRTETVERSRVRGRIGLDYSGITSTGSTPGTSTQVGLSFQSDMTHIMGTHWNLQGYWRGRINRHSQFQQDTIQDTLNKTYTMQLYYDNPDSKWVAGFGRLYLPWAVSLDTIDGGYIGRKVHTGVTTGVFAGSTPDLASWNYQPDRRIAGSFINFEGGRYEGLHYSSTSGLALSTVSWKLNRPFIFFENEVSYKGLVSVYHSLDADSPRGLTTDGIRPGAGIAHSYLTVHLQPSHRLSFDIYHNFFRDVPTAATQIIGTGLVDKLLFQGVSAGVHYEPIRHLILYTTLGRSEKTGDPKQTLNQMYGATWTEIAHTGVRADFHYSKFDSNFATGIYRVASLSRQMGNRFFWNLQVGKQQMYSPMTANNNSIFVANSMDINLGKHSYLQSGYSFVNGSTLNYRQWYLSWGYRFDQKQEAVELVQDAEPKQ
jgi:AMIN domain